MSGIIVITGATGFIGGALIKRLAADGRQVRALIRPAKTSKKPADVSATWVRGDLDDADSLRRLVSGTDAVIHCAGAVRGAKAEQFDRVNAEGVARLVQVAGEQRPVPRMLLISSLAAREPQLSAYAASKRKGEDALLAAPANMDWSIFRPSAVYGPGDRELLPVLRWMARGIAPLLGSGKGRFSLIYIPDLVDAVLHWLDCGQARGSIYELGDGKPGGYSWHDVADKVARLRGAPVARVRIPLSLLKLAAILNLAVARIAGYAPMLTPGKVRELSHTDWSACNEAINADTGWSPKFELAQGLRQTLKLDNPSTRKTGL